MAGFTRAVLEAVVGKVPPGYAFPDWETALDHVAENATGRIVVVLDEFQYLVETTSALPSLVQRWWDRKGRGSRVVLVLCGSAQSLMEGLDAGDSPLHQRFTKKIRLGPLSYREAGEFTPALEPAERARVYGILGGTPLYLGEWREAEHFEENLRRLFADPASNLVDSARLVLHADLGDAAASYRTLSAIANGATKRNDILQKARITNERVLERLEDLRFIERRVPITEGPGSRRGIYSVADPYFRFWFKFVDPNRGAIDRGLGERVVASIVRDFEKYMGWVFEEMARAFVRTLVAQGVIEGTDVGGWWSTDGAHEIDVVAADGRRVTAAGSVTWRAAKLGAQTLVDLESDLAALGAPAELPRLLIGRGGVEPALLAAHPGVLGYSAADLYL